MSDHPRSRAAKTNFKNDADIPDGATPVTFQRDAQGNISAYLDAAAFAGSGLHWDLLTNGDLTNPALIFAGGDVVWIPLP